jgi:hypothetical protein
MAAPDGVFARGRVMSQRTSTLVDAMVEGERAILLVAAPESELDREYEVAIGNLPVVSVNLMFLLKDLDALRERLTRADVCDAETVVLVPCGGRIFGRGVLTRGNVDRR